VTLTEHSSSIRSRGDFVEFVKSLTKDLRDNPTSWENVTLERFLEALGACVEDMDGYYLNQGKPLPAQIDWQIVGEMLMAARIYE
jgi:hypothetical protein